MSIAFDCEKCGRSYQVAGDLAGKRCRCKHCGHSFTIPAASGPTLDEIYALETDIPQSEPKEEAPSPRLNDKRKRTKVSGLFGLSGLPLWGFNVYRGVIAAVLIAALVVDGVPKLILALAGAFLCVGPFVASGFTYRFGVAFRDGPIAGLLYMFFMPYRIHYRLTHKALFQKLRAPTLTLRDFGLLLLGACFLPVILVAAKEMDKPKNHPPQIDWAHFGPQVNHSLPAAAVPKRPARPGLSGIGRRAGRKAAEAGPAPAEAPSAEAAPTEAAPAEPIAMEPWPDGAAPAEEASSPPAAASPVPVQPASPGSQLPGFPSFGPRPHRLLMPPGAMPSAPPALGPDETVTVTVTVDGGANPETAKRWNAAITEILKSSNSGWSVSYSTGGGKVTFKAGPVKDPRAFAEKIDFGRVRRIEGRSIEVQASP